ncbi:MAG: D-sedoheptulose 7-phosphate isomerase [Paludibacteraceae bacterium]|nr:D-sedoheptulose 7-phosphate isomerase [Paludibacteraceae bacterium]
MSHIETIKQHIEDSIQTKQRILSNEALLTQIGEAADLLIKAYQSGKKTLLAGNGGSAADAQHIAGEFVSKFYFDRPGIPSIALTTDTSILTAVGNDYGFERLFARQIEAQGQKGDVFIGISTSGNSKNILAALEACKAKGIQTIGLTGEKKCRMDDLCDIVLKIPSADTPRIQESHIMVGHILCGLVEEALFGTK